MLLKNWVELYCSYKEPINKYVLWLRPHLNREGFDMFYFGANGWTRWCPCSKVEDSIEEDNKDDSNECDGTVIPDRVIEPLHPDDNPCGCPD